jgi:hypothetical protein
MERRSEIMLPAAVSVSLCLHIFIIWAFLMPVVKGISINNSVNELPDSAFLQNDVVTNANENEREKVNDETLLSEKSSEGRGFLTKKKGDTFLNNSLEFTMPGTVRTRQGMYPSATALPQTSAAQGKESSSHNDAGEEPNGITIVQIDKISAADGGEAGSAASWTKIPDKKGISRENALYISNDGSFSFNTKKFKDFKYFKDMKNKISSNWFPPQLGNAVFGSGMNKYGFYTPGVTRIMMIPSQEVKIFFKMKRSGEVVDVNVLDQGNNPALVDSCTDAIKNSKSFGKVPEDMAGDVVIIPFIFGYYTD